MTSSAVFAPALGSSVGVAELTVAAALNVDAAYLYCRRLLLLLLLLLLMMLVAVLLSQHYCLHKNLLSISSNNL